MKKIMNRKVLIAALLIASTVFASFAALKFSVRGQEPATVYMVPSPSDTVTPCEDFSIDVHVDGITVEFPLDAFDIMITYDPNLVQAGAVTAGPFVPLGDLPLFTWTIDNLAGFVHFWTLPLNGITATGSGVIATVDFHCEKIGDALLHFEPACALYDPDAYIIPAEYIDQWIYQTSPYWEPVKLFHIVEWPGTVAYWDMLFVPPASPEGYVEVKAEIEAKGYVFDPEIGGTAMAVEGSIEEEGFSGNVTSWWSSNTLEDGTRACMLSAEMDDGSSMAMGFVTNLLPPEQVPGVDPHIIVNAMPYMYVRFYWWAWYPIGRVVSWPYWWYDSHSHPNWFWGPYWWWRCYTKDYFFGTPYPPVETKDQYQEICEYCEHVDTYWISWQEFVPSATSLSRVEVMIARTLDQANAFPINMTIESPLGNVLTSKTLQWWEVPELPWCNATWISFDVPDIALTPGQSYYIVLDSEPLAYHWCFASWDAYPPGQGGDTVAIGSDGDWTFRTFVGADAGWAYWRPWWGWWWHWVYWRHWYWWSTYFPYDP